MAEIDIEKLAREADECAGSLSLYATSTDWGSARDRILAALVLEEAGLVCDNLGTRAGTADQCADALRTIAEGLKK